MSRSRRIILLSFLCLGLSSCAWSLGGSSKIQQATVGQELIALKAALEKGAINQEEHDEARRDLLDSARRR